MNPTNIPSAQARLPGSLPPALIGRAQTCLENAVTFALDTQHANGSWAERPEARILDTATVTYALSSTPAGASACTRARVWLEQALPQCHDEFTAAADHWLRLLASSPTPPPLPILPRADGPHARRALLLDGIGVSAGSAGADAQRLLHSTTTALSPDRGRSLKSWQRTMLLALEIIARQTLRLPIPAMTLEALESEQGDDGRFHGMPLLTAVAYLALTQTVPGRASTRRSLSSLLADQQADGTWRFPTFDVWDTSLMVRFLRGHPTFHKYACTRALAFLERTQSADGGWGCTSAFVGSTALASDNDTTGSVLLALANTPHGHRAWPAAAAYARTRQNAAGLWTTWQSSDDTPVPDVVAHMIAGIHSHDAHAVDTGPASDWLRAAYRQQGRWTADWYTFPSYAVTEIAPVAGWQAPESLDAVQRLLDAQNPNGSWPRIHGQDHSSPAATGLAVSALAASGADAHSHSHAIEKAVRYLLDSQDTNGTWIDEQPFMYGPRPFLAAVPVQAHAMACRGIHDLLKPRQGTSPER